MKVVYYCIREAAKQMVITGYQNQEMKNMTTNIGTVTAGGDCSIISSPYAQFPRLKQMLIPFHCQDSTLSLHLESESNL